MTSETDAKPSHQAVVDIESRGIPQKNVLATENIANLDVLVVPLMIASQTDTDAPIGQLNLFPPRYPRHIDLIGFDMVFTRGIEPVRTVADRAEEIADPRFGKQQS